MVKKLRSFGKRFFIFLNILAVIGLLLSYASKHVSPVSHPLPALFGLSYIFWLGINVIFVLFWVLVKWKMALLSLLAIGAGYNALFSTIQPLPQLNAPPDGTDPIRVVSYNVRLFGWYDWRNNVAYRDSLVADLIPLDADIYCFQEYFHSSKPGEFNTEGMLIQKLGTPYANTVYTNWVGQHQKYGIATFSKYPIVGSGRVNFMYDDGNICIYNDLLIGHDTVRLFNAHVASIRFQPEDYRFMDEIKTTDKNLKPVMKDGMDVLTRLNIAYKKRADQVEAMTKAIRQSPYPVILCSDLNDTPVSYSYTLLAGELTDSFRESGLGFSQTYIGKFPSFRIDYIFHDSHFQGYNYRRLPPNISDHRGITTDLYPIRR